MASLTSGMLAEVISATSGPDPNPPEASSIVSLFISQHHAGGLQKTPRPKATVSRGLYGSEPYLQDRKENFVMISTVIWSSLLSE